MSAENAIERMQLAIDSLQELSSSLSAQLVENQLERGEAEEALAKQSRNGERGSDWQVLQSKIDLNQTSLSDVLGGADLSPHAVRIRALLSSNIDQLNERIEILVEDDPDETSPRAEASELLEQMQDRVRDFQQRFGTV